MPFPFRVLGPTEWRKSLASARTRRAGFKQRIETARIKYMDKTESNYSTKPSFKLCENWLILGSERISLAWVVWYEPQCGYPCISYRMAHDPVARQIHLISNDEISKLVEALDNYFLPK